MALGVPHPAAGVNQSALHAGPPDINRHRDIA
jgi:hypothetical protein